MAQRKVMTDIVKIGHRVFSVLFSTIHPSIHLLLFTPVYHFKDSPISPIILSPIHFYRTLASLPLYTSFHLSENLFNRVESFLSAPAGIYLVKLMDSWEMTTGSGGGRRTLKGKGRRTGAGSSFVCEILLIAFRPDHITALLKCTGHAAILKAYWDVLSWIWFLYYKKLWILV